MNTALKVIRQSRSKIDLMSSAGTRWCHQIPPSGLGKRCRRGRGKSVRATEDERYHRESRPSRRSRAGTRKNSETVAACAGPARSAQVGVLEPKEKETHAPMHNPETISNWQTLAKEKWIFSQRVSPGKLTTRAARLRAKQYTASTKQAQQHLWISVSQC